MPKYYSPTKWPHAPRRSNASNKARVTLGMVLPRKAHVHFRHVGTHRPRHV